MFCDAVICECIGVERDCREGWRSATSGVQLCKSEHLSVRQRAVKVKVPAVAQFRTATWPANPHRLEFTARFLPSAEKQIEVSCSCKGGQGVCKHAVALLFFLSRNKLADISEATCTDVTQIWGRIKKNSESMYDAVPIKTFCHGAPDNRVQFRIREDVFPHANELILKYAPNSELKKLKEKRRSLIQIRATTNNRCTIIDAAFCQRVLSACIHPPLDENYILFAEQNGQELELKYLDDLGDSEKSFYKSDVEVSLDRAVQICLDTISQSNPRWKRERHSRMTASDAYLYISPWLKPAHAVNWNEKVRKYLTTDFKGNPATHYGSRMEPRARECYAKMVKQDVVLSGLMINPAIPWLGFSPDGFVPNLNRIIEIKCPYKFKDSPVHELIEKNFHS
ncbi:hypothetical protein QAD02_007252 [Eretmocerus hayati]|uniref:Uncharacterized protein n=1 Tax=Eretmocerus hayati TaxID=131215 RepID=A0ACC2N344_9HYME|nr:hypothetical protein QAD02_007252 [Eretmocerus hayati]